jgi:uncharacterized Zn-binding protein involved in type VI secretion
MKAGAKEGDKVVASDTHLVSGASVVVSFEGRLKHDLSSDVLSDDRNVATVGSIADCTPPHVPPQGKSFDVPPHHRATVVVGSSTVLVNNKAYARDGDAAETCNDPVDLPVGSVEAAGTVLVG